MVSGTPVGAIDGKAMISAALAGQDPQARSSAEAFARMLGQVAGDLALLFQAGGGIWLSGGPTRALRPLLADPDGPFQRAFTDKGRMAPVMKTFPVHLVTSDQAAIAGCLSIATGTFKDGR